MTERPIIFSAPMVRALLDGRKTQTRRIIKDRGDLPQFCGGKYDDRNDPECWGWEDSDTGGWVTLDQFRRYRFVPYAPGDRLWVREGWKAHHEYDGAKPPGIPPDETDDIWHTADSHLEPVFVGRPRSPIHMPRWASRLTLIVTDVRVQRLQDISEADAKAEGLATVTKDGNLWKWGIADSDGLPGNDDHGWHWSEWQVDTRAAYMRLWNQIHGPDAWDANPWVAAITFDVKRGNIDWLDT